MSKFEQKHVHDVYSTIADHFSHTRYRGWPKIEKYLQNLSAGLSVLDIACGNGKYMGYNKQCQFTGIDMCNGLLQICRKRGYNVVQGDMTCLPFLQGTFDQFICIAALTYLFKLLPIKTICLFVFFPNSTMLFNLAICEENVVINNAELLSSLVDANASSNKFLAILSLGVFFSVPE